MLKQRTPLKRGNSQLKRTPFKRKGAPPSATVEKVCKPITVRDPSLFRLPRQIESACASIEISPRRENSALRDFARGQPCLLLVPGHCTGDKATTVGCHSNWSEHGKGKSRKADDHYMVWGCMGCHGWLDQGNARQNEKRAIFDDALVRQVAEYKKALKCTSLPKRFQQAVKWALEELASDHRLEGLEASAIGLGLLTPMHLPERFKSPFQSRPPAA